MKNEEKTPKKPQTKSLRMVDVITSCSYWVTPHLRYSKKEIPIDEHTTKYELRLQQMWQGQDGSQKWEWVEYVE